jgi:PAS domain S-box-containing protein
MNSVTAKILIVEDERIVALDISATLKALGYEIASFAVSGYEAVNIVEKEKPDLILMDIRIKGEIDGIQTAELIQSNYNIPIIYLTASADENTLSRAKITGPYGYVIKPYDKKILHSVIEMALYKNRMERKAKENERWLSKTLQSMGDAMVTTDKEGNIKLMNLVAESKTGWKLEEATGRNINEIMHLASEDTGELLDHNYLLFHDGQSEEINRTAILTDKEFSKKIITETVSVIKGDKNITTGIVVLFRDITRHRSEEKEKERLFKEVSSAQERLKELSKRLLEIQEAERRHIARELHDEIGQILTAIKINIQTAFKLAGSKKVEVHLNEGVELIEEALFQVRKLSVDLRPSMLDDLGLVPALRWYVDKHSTRSGIKAKVVADEIIKRLPPDIEITCFRVSQEALTNIIKHAKASDVEINLFYKNDDLNLQIKDDGVGFNFFSAIQKGLKGESMGLLGMQERVELIGGRIKINSKPGGGTQINVVFPSEVLNSK